ncbi:MAG: cyclic nucleotide-binding domain-containing protein [Labilithrix sp.]|nr:cyclic nucleotide-binding domain-containing protein [Labilithrix sp.]MCW5813770.1 cyclic nucleotide-binding domain-containing protein [Labilithrix sp.]
MRRLDLTERLLRLRGVPVFRSIPTSALASLAASIRSNTFEKGQVILREDEPPRAFHMLLTGSVTMRRHGYVIRTITAPGGVGFMSVLARTAGGTEAVAESRVETFELSVDALDEMFEDHFPVLFGTMRWIGERLVDENARSPPRPYQPPPEHYEDLIGDGPIGIVERIFLVRRTLAFRRANVNSVARLARQMKEVRFPAGEHVWRAGDASTGSYFIVKGKGELRWNDGKSVQEVGPSYIVGGVEAIAGKPRWNDLYVTEPITALVGNREGLIDMFEDDLDVALVFMSMMASFLLELWDRRAEREAG